MLNFPSNSSQIPDFRRSLQVHGKARQQVSLVPGLWPWPTNGVYTSFSSHLALGLSLKHRPKSVCQFTFDVNPVSKTCTWNLLEFTKNDLKNFILENSAFLRSQGKVGLAPLGQSSPLRILCACTLLDLRLPLCWNFLHSFLPCFSLLGNCTKVRSLSD